MITSSRTGLDEPETPLTHHSLGSAVDGLTGSAESLVHRTAEKTRAQASRLVDAGSLHIRERPLQSMLVAAATGAVLVLLVELVVRSARSSR